MNERPFDSDSCNSLRNNLRSPHLYDDGNQESGRKCDGGTRNARLQVYTGDIADGELIFVDHGKTAEVSYVQMFVFGEVQDPNQETVNLVEDIVRSQIIELVCQYIRAGAFSS